VSRREARSDKRAYQTVSGAIIVTAGGRRDNCANGLPGAWFCGSETRHYIGPRSLPGVMMRRGQAAEPAGQPPGIPCLELAQPWVGGGSKRMFQGAGRRPRLRDRGRRNKLEAARALAGRRSFSSSKRLRVRPAWSVSDRNKNHCEPDSTRPQCPGCRSDWRHGRQEKVCR